MSIVRYSPIGRFGQLHGEINRLFDQLSSTSDDGTRVATSEWVPAVDITEEDARFVIHADVPGVDAKDIEVTMQEGVLSIRGERRLEAKVEGENYKRVERAHGSFYRSFTLPDTADSDQISAKCKNGVLEVIIPKREPVRPRRVTIQS